MKLDRRSVVGGIWASTALLAVPSGARAMNEQRLDIAVPRFRGASDVGPPHPNAVLAMHLVIDAVGMRRSIDLFSANITKDGIAGFATVIGGRRYIVYDRESVTWAEGVTQWTSVSLVAHEVGHHLGTHMHRRDVSGHAEELEADRFAGFALAKLGATEEQATSYYQSDRPATRDHPSAADCREAVREGWKLGQRMKRQEALRIRRGR